MSSSPVPSRLWNTALLSIVGFGAGALVVRVLASASTFATIGAVAAVALAVAVFRVAVLRPDKLLSVLRTKEELIELAETSRADGSIEERSAQMLSRSARFNDITVSEILTPRTSIVALPMEATGADLDELSQRSGLSRALLYRGDIDDIAGVVHVKSLLHLPPEERAGVALGELSQDVAMVPETRSLRDVLAEMRHEHSWLAVVLDEYGGTSGIVTIEDVLEVLVGEIDDEHDRGARRRVVRLAGTSVLAGDMNLAEVAEVTGAPLPDGPYETLGGFVMAQLGRVPERGESFVHEGSRFEVLDMDRHRITAVRVSDHDADERAETASADSIEGQR